MTTFNKVKLIIVEQLGVNESDVTMEAILVDDLGADSLDEIELLIILEDEYNTEIEDEDVARKLKTVGQIVDYINKELN